MSSVNRTKQINFRIAEDLYYEVKQRADDLNKTISLYLNDLVIADLNQQKGIANIDISNNPNEIGREILNITHEMEKIKEDLEKLRNDNIKRL